MYLSNINSCSIPQTPKDIEETQRDPRQEQNKGIFEYNPLLPETSKRSS